MVIDAEILFIKTVIPVMTIFKRSYDFCLSTFQFQILYGERHVVDLHNECALGKKYYFLIS